MKRAVKYCGGCNPRFDRLETARILEQKLGGPLPAAEAGEQYDELYVICGCPSRCADISALSAGQVIWIEQALT